MESGGLPRNFGDYRFDREAGRGAMGVVYEAEQISTGRHCAVKLLARGVQPDSEDVERFRREGRVAGSIAHPRTVFVYAADEVDGTPYIAMEWMSGGTLKDLVQKDGPLPVARAVDCTLQALDGLIAAAAAGVVHRDVKPSNCFVDADGTVKVGDFGLAKSLRGSFDLTLTGEFIGTPYYASPEQVRGRDIDPRSDQYSLAATLFYLLTGRPLFPGSHAGDVLGAIVSDVPPRVRSLRPEVPRGLDRLIQRAVSKDPADRYQDHAAFRRALLPYATQSLLPAARGPRFAAWVVDVVLSSWLGLAVIESAQWIAPLPDAAITTLVRLITLLWFVLFEGSIGRTPGKALFGLAVGRRPHGAGSDSRVPSLVAAFQRTLLYMLCLSLGNLLPSIRGYSGGVWIVEWLTRDAWSGIGAFTFSGALVLLSTMRRRNGWRGPHELLSRTFVYQRPHEEEVVRRRKTAPSPPLPCSADPALPASLGSFQVRGVLARSVPGFGQTAQSGIERGTLLLARDPSLGRAAWILLRPAGAAPLSAPRRDLRRATRLRWLGGGRTTAGGWDAFEAPEGGPLPDVVRHQGPLPWTEARHLLLELAEELQAAARDGTLPTQLSLASIWITPAGRLRLLDSAPTEAFPTGELVQSTITVPLLRKPARDGTLSPALERALLSYLSGVAVTLVAPAARRARDGGLPEARDLPLPGHAAEALRALRDDAELSFDAALDRLRKLTRRTASVTRGMRIIEALPPVVSLLSIAGAGWIASSDTILQPLDVAAVVIQESQQMPRHDADAQIVVDAANVLLAASSLQELREAGVVTDRPKHWNFMKLRGSSWSEAEASTLIAAARTAHPAPTQSESMRAERALDNLRSRMIHVLFVFILLAVVFLMGLLGGLIALVGRGGLVLGLIGVNVHARGHGQAGRLRCAWRAAGVWLVMCVPLFATVVWVGIEAQQRLPDGSRRIFVLRNASPSLFMPADVLLLLSVLLLLAILALPIWKPRVSVQDWLARTQLLPR